MKVKGEKELFLSFSSPLFTFFAISQYSQQARAGIPCLPKQLTKRGICFSCSKLTYELNCK